LFRFTSGFYLNYFIVLSQVLLRLVTVFNLMKYSFSLLDKLVPVTTAWRGLGLRVEERPPIWSVAASILNKQSRTVDTRWSSSLGVGRGANNSSP